MYATFIAAIWRRACFLSLSAFAVAAVAACPLSGSGVSQGHVTVRFAFCPIFDDHGADDIYEARLKQYRVAARGLTQEME